MRIEKSNIAIIDPSEIVVKGITSALQNKNTAHIVVNFSSTSLPVFAIPEIDIVIINPIITSTENQSKLKNLFPFAKFIAIVYHFIEKKTLKSFDDVIEINDSTQRIKQVIETTLQKKTEENSDTEMDELSDREKDILIAVSKGMLNKQIADQYNISIHTVVTHRKNITRKIGIRTVAGLVVYALLNNLIEESEILK